MSTNMADSSLDSTEAARAAYMRRDGLPYWVKFALAAAERKEREGTLHFFRRRHVFFFSGWPSTGEWRKNPHLQNVLNTPPCWQLQKSEDPHPSNSSNPSCTLAVRVTGEGEAYSTVE